MKKISHILLFLFLFCTLFDAQANYRETDFSPFPLSASSETLLNGYWESNNGYLEIVEIRHYSINEHSWFIIYEMETPESTEKAINGFIFYDANEEVYKRVYWTDSGLVVNNFILYRLEDRENESLGQYCVQMNTYMLKMDEEMFVRTDCDI